MLTPSLPAGSVKASHVCLEGSQSGGRGRVYPARTGSQVARPRAPGLGERKCVPNREVRNQPKWLLPAPGEAAGPGWAGWVTRGQGKGSTKPQWLQEAEQDGGPEQSGPCTGPQPGAPRCPNSPALLLAPAWVLMLRSEGGFCSSRSSPLASRRQVDPKGGHAGAAGGQPRLPE